MSSVSTVPFEVLLDQHLSDEERLKVFEDKEKIEEKIEKRELKLKEYVKAKKEKLKKSKSRARKLGRIAFSGKRTTKVACRHEVNLEDKELLTIRIDTGKAVENLTRPLTPEEVRQYSQLPLKGVEGTPNADTAESIRKEREEDDKKDKAEREKESMAAAATRGERGLVITSFRGAEAVFNCTVHGERSLPCGCPPKPNGKEEVVDADTQRSIDIMDGKVPVAPALPALPESTGAEKLPEGAVSREDSMGQSEGVVAKRKRGRPPKAKPEEPAPA